MRKYRSEQQIPDWRHMSKDMFNHFLTICVTISAISASAAAAIGAVTALKNNDTSNDK